MSTLTARGQRNALTVLALVVASAIFHTLVRNSLHQTLRASPARATGWQDGADPAEGVSKALRSALSVAERPAQARSLAAPVRVPLALGPVLPSEPAATASREVDAPAAPARACNVALRLLLWNVQQRGERRDDSALSRVLAFASRAGYEVVALNELSADIDEASLAAMGRGAPPLPAPTLPPPPPPPLPTLPTLPPPPLPVTRSRHLTHGCRPPATAHGYGFALTQGWQKKGSAMGMLCTRAMRRVEHVQPEHIAHGILCAEVPSCCLAALPPCCPAALPTGSSAPRCRPAALPPCRPAALLRCPRDPLRRGAVLLPCCPAALPTRSSAPRCRRASPSSL